MKPRGPAAAFAASATVAALLVFAPSPAGAAFGCSTPEVVTEVEDEGIDASSPFVLTLDGSQVLMNSNEDPLGTNPDDGDELFVYDRILDRLEQRTDFEDEGDIPSHGHSMDQNASRLAFASDGDPLGSNVDGNYEIFFLGANTIIPGGQPVLLQLTNTTGGTHTPSVSMSADGSRIAFTSDRNLDASNADLGTELYLATVSGALAVAVEQLGSNGATNPAMAQVEISDAGGFVTYLTSATSRGAFSNADGSLEVARTAISAGEPTINITSLPGGSTTNTPSIDATGNRVAFATTAQVIGDSPNTDGLDEVYVRDVTAGTNSRMTNSSQRSASPDISGDGEVVVYEADSPDIARRTIDTFTGFNVSQTGGSKPVTDAFGEHVAFEVDVAGGSGDKEELVMAICKEPTFIDVGVDHPFFAEVEWMADEGISTGSDPGPTYNPSASVSRQAMSAFMFRLAGEPSIAPPPQPSFTDVDSGHPFFEEIEWMAATGISEGFLPGPTYRPAVAVSRAAMSAFMFRLANQSFDAPSSATFADVGPSHPFFREIEFMADRGVTTGFQPGPTYRPSSPVTRQAMSAFMQRLGERVPFIPPPPTVP
jgi:Tol biopolymer transport system component